MAVSTKAIPQTVASPLIPLPDFVWKLSVEQYHEMINTGILDEDDPIELLEGNISNYEANLMDVSGKNYWNETLKNRSQTFSVEKLTVGLYFLRVGNGEKNSVVKVVVE